MTLRKYQRGCLLLFTAFVLTVAFVSIATKALFASSSNVRPGCAYTIQHGDTLGQIASTFRVPLSDLVSVNPVIVDPDLIYAGDTIDRCAANVTDGRRPSLSAGPTLPGLAEQWARAVATTAPDWATYEDARLLVALAGPESAWCTNTVNPRDANPPVWGPSVGCPQIRTMLDPGREPWRNREWLETSIVNQAQAAWIIYQAQGHLAWGPRHDGKLPDNCEHSISPSRCRDWWATADIALGHVGFPITE